MHCNKDMRKRLGVLLNILLLAAVVAAAPVKNMPVARVQPNGDTLYCLVSGDEFFHRLHDAEGYTIVQDEKTGAYVYADLQDGVLVPMQHRVGSVDPAQIGLVPNLVPGSEELKRLHRQWEIPEKYWVHHPKTGGANHGQLNNIVIFVRFADEAVCTAQSFGTIDAMFNDSTAGASSMYNYFKTTSYGNLHVVTTYRPQPSGAVVVSYQDSCSRGYYMPYSATNPIGYADADARREREFGLIERAVNWVNANCPVSGGLNIDMDGDGMVDNICFVISGSYTGWSDLLWPHKWALYDRQVFINGKRVYTFNLQLAGSGDHYFSVSTFCHEMTHTLGAPDLYNYYHYTNVTPAGSWDLMCASQNPPQQTNALFKLNYLNWFDSIPEITDTGVYTLQSLATGSNRAYKIASGTPYQWYILEYRNDADTFDATIPNGGLLVWRYNGSGSASNADFNNVDTLHELWLFRPNSSDDITAGNVGMAAFGVEGRNIFSAACGSVAAASNPYPYLCNGAVDTTFSLTNIQVSGDRQSVSFMFTPHGGNPCPPVTTFPETMDFEDETTGCWTPIAASSSNRGRMGVYGPAGAMVPHGGSYYFRFCSYSSAADYNQYLVSPRLESSSPLHLVFYYGKFLVGEECFRVRYSTTTDDTAAFVHTLADVHVISSGWHRCELTVPAAAKYVAFNYYSDYVYYLCLDDIQLRDTSVRDTTYIYVHDTVYYRERDTITVTVYDTHYFSPTKYRVQVYANEPERGTASGNGVFPDGTLLEIAGIAAPGYAFDHWTDGNRENPRRVVVVGNQQYGACFVASASKEVRDIEEAYHDTIYIHDTVWIPSGLRDTVINYVYGSCDIDTTTYYELSVLSSDMAKGIVAGSGRFPVGTDVEVAALAQAGYRLVRWDDNSSDNPKVVRIMGDMTVLAYFDTQGSEGVGMQEFSPVRVHAQGSGIVIASPYAAQVAVYNVSGQCVCRTRVGPGTTRLSSFRDGIYLVQVGSAAARKVVVMGE